QWRPSRTARARRCIWLRGDWTLSRHGRAGAGESLRPAAAAGRPLWRARQDGGTAGRGPLRARCQTCASEAAVVVGFYRLNYLAFRLAAGAHVVKRADCTAIEEATRLVAQAEAKAAAIMREADEAYEREKLRGYEDGLVEARIESIERLLAESSL